MANYGPRVLMAAFSSVCIITALYSIYHFKWTQRFSVLHTVGRFPVLTRAFRTYKLENTHNAEHYQEVLGKIWPMSENETDNRIISQILFMDMYRTHLLDVHLINKSNRSSEPEKTTRKMKVILRVGDVNFEWYKEGQEIFLKCPINSCVLTMNKSLIHTADALLISEFGQKLHKTYLPKPPNQIWIAQNSESPHFDTMDASAIKDLINWTASYRRASTIVNNYGHWERKKESDSSLSGSVVPFNYASGKTKKVAMLASNCKPHSNRMQYARELQKYIAVDIYGACGDHQCPRHFPTRQQAIVPCVKWIAKDYKFYLAFENSICKDYITEKLLQNALKNSILPIVLGAPREDYAVAAPPHSYIHVDDFSNPQELALYLHRIDKNNTLYNEYFAWKPHYSLIKNQQYLCRMCMMLHLQEEVGYRHWYSDYNKWLNDVCSSSQGYNSIK